MSSYVSFKPKRALLSLSDKQGLVELAKVLSQHQVELVATGNTAALLRQHNIAVTEVSDCTGFPEMMDGRVKTLHPAIHAGLLAREEDMHTLRQLQIEPIDLLLVNLYPFQEVVANPDCAFKTAIEHIDIGGPAMIRSAAKNHARTYVIVSPEDYESLAKYLEAEQAPADWGLSLAKKAFSHTKAYDAAIADYLNGLGQEDFPEVFNCQFNKKSTLRYGENPHQKAAFYADKRPLSGSLGASTLIQGKELSYNNILDADAALDCVKSFPKEPSVCVIVKHANPCGIAQSNTALDAYLRAFQADPISAYGGIIAFNSLLDAETASAILEKQFVEVIVAPSVTEEAKQVLHKKENIRLLITGVWQQHRQDFSLKKVDGGLLVQAQDILLSKELTPATPIQASAKQLQDLLFAWTAVKHVKSNAIVYAKNCTTIGIGAGQTSRVMSAKIGLWQAEQIGLNTQGAVMASDAFIPFQDTIEIAAQAGIKAIIQPGGSIRDKEIIQCATEQGIAMLFTGMRHFKH